MQTIVKEGYKAVFICHGATLFIGLQDRGLEYILNNWTIRPSMAYGPLTVFVNEPDAGAFIKTMGAAIYMKHKYALCRYVPSRKTILRSPKLPGERTHLRDLPKGTVCAEMVMLETEL